MISEDKKYFISRNDWRKLGFELIVVFLGVTAGFLLNSWRIDMQESRLQNKYLEGFLQDIDNNIEELENSIFQDSVWLSVAKPNLEKIRDRNIRIDSAEVIMKYIIQISKVSLNRGTYLDIINSGNLNILSNYRLKSDLVDYYLHIEGVEFVDNYFTSYFNDFVMPFIFQEFNVLSGEFVDPGIIRTIRFSNVFAGYYSMVQQRKASYEKLLNKSVALKAHLEGK